MSFLKNKYRTQSVRLKGWDYSSDGYYFVTICVKNMSCCFGRVIDGDVQLSRLGHAAYACWLDILQHHSYAPKNTSQIILKTGLLIKIIPLLGTIDTC